MSVVYGTFVQSEAVAKVSEKLAEIIELKQESGKKLTLLREQINGANKALAECAYSSRKGATIVTELQRKRDEIVSESDIAIADLEEEVNALEQEIARRKALPPTPAFLSVKNDVEAFARVYQGPFCDPEQKFVHHADDKAGTALYLRTVLSTHDIHCYGYVEGRYPVEFGYACTEDGVFLTVDKIVSHLADGIPLGIVTSIDFQFGSTFHEEATIEEFFDAFGLPDIAIERGHYAQRLVLIDRLNSGTSFHASVMPIITRVEIDDEWYDLESRLANSPEWISNLIQSPPFNETPTFDADVRNQTITIKIPTFTGEWKAWATELQAVADAFGPPATWPTLQKVVIDLRGNRGGAPDLAVNLYTAITYDLTESYTELSVVTDELRAHMTELITASGHAAGSRREKMQLCLTMPQHAYLNGEAYADESPSWHVEGIIPEALRYEILYDKHTFSSALLFMRLFLERCPSKTTFDGGLLPCSLIDVCTCTGDPLSINARYMYVANVRGSEIEFDPSDRLKWQPAAVPNTVNPDLPQDINAKGTVVPHYPEPTTTVSATEFQDRVKIVAAAGFYTDGLVQ